MINVVCSNCGSRMLTAQADVYTCCYCGSKFIPSSSKQTEPESIQAEQQEPAEIKRPELQHAPNNIKKPSDASEKYPVEKLNDDQRRAFDLVISSNNNFYITGKAGTGKSYLLKTIVHNTSKEVAIVAPTGIAAINIGGQTIHSFFGMGISIQATHDQNEVHRGLNEKRIKIMNSIDMLIIDEVSMVRVDVMDMIDTKLRAARKSNEPFGGVQIICFGDLYQLPPVVEDSEVINKYFSDMYGTTFFFGAPVVREKPFTTIELSQVMRQNDPEFINILNSIREGNNQAELIDRLNVRQVKRPKGQQCITLVTTNSAANVLNHRRLEELESEEFLYSGLVEGSFEKDDLPTNMVLTLKKGAQVMMLRNNPGKWVNGTIGKVVNLTPDLIVVQTPKGTFPIDKETWVKYEYQFNEELKRIERVEIGWFTQYPIKLSYAITIHKSQGQTYDAIEVDYSSKRAFAPGQTYVALSRCKNFDTLYLTVPMTPDDIKANQEVIDFMHGNFQAKPRTEITIPLADNTKKRSPFTWRDDKRIEAQDVFKHKKITGTRLPNILNLVERVSPFTMWCAMMHVYEEPFKDTIWTRAGEIIEPKQFEYVKKVMAKEGRVFISPTDRYGADYKNRTGYDFFRLYERFGGMWDYLLEREDKTVMVFEMKTTGINNKKYWLQNLPKKYIMQAALYAWMLGIDWFCMVCSFLQKEDYDAPENYVCNENNTIIRPMQISKYFSNFDKEVLMPAMQWWDDYIETGISPKYDEERDSEVLAQLRKITEEENETEDDYYDRKAAEQNELTAGRFLLLSDHLDKQVEELLSSSNMPTTKPNKTAKPKDYDDDDSIEYFGPRPLGIADDGKFYTEESWYETHSNPWGTIDTGDGYVDSDGIYTEY